VADSFISLRRNSCCRFLPPLKIHRPRQGLNPRTFGPIASTKTTRPPRTTHVALLPKTPTSTSPPLRTLHMHMICVFQGFSILEIFAVKLQAWAWTALSMWAYYNKSGNARCVRNGPCPFPLLRHNSPPVRLFPRGCAVRWTESVLRSW
jgi:hypothetical protein